MLAVCFVCCFLPGTLQGAEEPVALPPEVFTSIWLVPKLYKNSENSIIQSFAIVGRYHGQYWYSESEGNSAHGWENRRFYLGFNTKFLQQFTLELQVNISEDFDPVVKSLYDGFLKWETTAKDLAISVGRLDYVYTGLERSTSSKRIKTMERELLVNQIMPGEVAGLYMKGSEGGLDFQAGVFSGSINDTFTSFAGGFATLIGVSGDVPLFYDTGVLHLDYLYNNGNEDNNAFKPYRDILSLWHQGSYGVLEIDLDVTIATGVGEVSDVYGVTLLPTYDLVENLFVSEDTLRLALRYHYASSRDAYGLEFNKRYEQNVASGRGDSYNSYYVGFIYDIYAEKLKIMGGIEYFNMDGVTVPDNDLKEAVRGVDGWSFISGVRLYF